LLSPPTHTLFPYTTLFRSQLFGISIEAEITTEANPDSLTRDAIEELAAGGFNRISMGMQSAVPHVLQVLERTHNPANVVSATQRSEEHTSELQSRFDLVCR